jgi:hypothetical protein
MDDGNVGDAQHQQEHAATRSSCLGGEQHIGDVSIIHPGAATYCAVPAQTDGGAAACCDAEKRYQYGGYGASCYHFVPLTVETYGRLGKLITDVRASATSRATTSSHVTSLSLECSASCPSACAGKMPIWNVNIGQRPKLAIERVEWQA